VSTPEGTGALLQLTGVSKRYRRGPQELCVLRDVSLELHAGEIVSVLGMRGGGKTTLLRIAAGMESADEGAVRFAGRDLTGLSDGELSRLLGGQIAWAGRSGPGMRVRMLDYVAMPLLVGKRRERARGARKTVYRQARCALERVGAAGCEEQRWEDLSDWERALVETAQAIAAEPALLLIDDITDALGIRETDALTSLLRRISRESRTGILMALSDAQAALWSDRIMTLSGGTLTQGPAAPGGNVIEFPGHATPQRDLGRGSTG
jgi:ABC-type cobalamin/Fe3+-siderophores transport system ATPase subunit